MRILLFKVVDLNFLRKYSNLCVAFFTLVSIDQHNSDKQLTRQEEIAVLDIIMNDSEKMIYGPALYKRIQEYNGLFLDVDKFNKEMEQLVW